MLIDREKSAVLLIDVQEKLTPLVINSAGLIKRSEWLIRLANELSVPTVVSEHYSRGLGKTVEPLQALISKVQPIEKNHFSCYREPAFVNHWQSVGKTHVVIAGIETHVCVLQTAIDMLNANNEVFVVVDAVSSRNELDHKFGQKRMKQEGVHLVTAEMVFFEWVVRAGTPEFKSLSQAFIK